MTAGAGALLVLVGGGAAGVATLTGGGEPSTSVAGTSSVAEVDLGAPKLEEDPEVVSRAAAAAEPLPQRHTTAPTRPAATRPAPARPASARAATTAPATDQLSRAREADDRADRTGPRSPRTSVVKTAPEVTTRTDVETRPVPFPTRLVRDPVLPRGTRKIQSPGVAGEETLRYLVTLTDGKPTQRRLVDTTVTRKPEPRVVAFGARKGRDCEGALRVCVPLGRSAQCPEDPAQKTPAVREEEQEVSAVQLGGSVLLSEEDLELISPETLDEVRLEPATLC
ncbi:G5 domain-containing protein [Actinoplanes sp. NPDC051861]|uniref:G5 domain-containing protein n=1 Tax=Actinoplanes sp. NPDC051861 TaxID=3155170 RepID=UPI00344274EF